MSLSLFLAVETAKTENQLASLRNPIMWCIIILQLRPYRVTLICIDISFRKINDWMDAEF